MTPISRLTNKRYFNAPSPAPNHTVQPTQRDCLHCFRQQCSYQRKRKRHSYPNSDKCQYLRQCHRIRDLRKHFLSNRCIQCLCCQQVRQSVPTMEANCLTKPFIKPKTAPTPITTNMMISMIAITILKRRGLHGQTRCFM